MQVVVTELDDWDVEEELDTGIPAFRGAGQEIRPSLTRHRDVIVTGRDFIPIKNGSAALLVHSPEAYFEKKRVQALRQASDGVVATTGPVRRISEPAILIGGSTNYYHWLIDNVPKILMARQVMVLPKLLINRAPSTFQIDTLSLLGVTEWEEVDPDESVRCDDLWIPSGLARSTVAHSVIPKMLRSAFPPTEKLPPRKIYLSRRDAESRRLVNEATLLEVLEDHEVCVASGMRFQEQVNRFASAETFVAAHGAGMTNMVFCQPGSTVYEIFTPLHQVTSMRFLAAVSGLRHHFIPARNVTWGADGRPLLGDWEVDVAAAKHAIQSVADQAP